MELPFEQRPYRRNVAAVVVNGDGMILTCRRSDFGETWQLPQGGMEDGESPEAALVRELEEEIGTSDVDIIGRLPEPIRYDWPPEVAHKNFRGQEQVYFLVRLRPGAVVDLLSVEKPEFDRADWLGLDSFFERVDRTSKGGFKFIAYQTALDGLNRLFPGVISR